MGQTWHKIAGSLRGASLPGGLVLQHLSICFCRCLTDIIRVVQRSKRQQEVARAFLTGEAPHNLIGQQQKLPCCLLQGALNACIGEGSLALTPRVSSPGSSTKGPGQEQPEYTWRHSGVHNRCGRKAALLLAGAAQRDTGQGRRALLRCCRYGPWLDSMRWVTEFSPTGMKKRAC